jgi:hypothetical protein
VFLHKVLALGYARLHLRGVGVKDTGETVPAVLVEEDRADEEQDGEARGHGGVLYGEHTQRYDLRQDQGEHHGVVHDRPQLPSHLILRVIHIQDLHKSFICLFWRSKDERAS